MDGNVATPRSVARPTEFRIMAALPPPPPSVDQAAASQSGSRPRTLPDAGPTTMTMLGSFRGRESVDHRTRRVHGKQQPRLATRGGGTHGYYVPDRDSAAAKTNSASRARIRCTAPTGLSVKATVEEVLPRAHQKVHTYDTIYIRGSLSSQHAR